MAPGRWNYVTALALDPTTPGTLYAGTFFQTEGGVFKSIDGGGTRSRQHRPARRSLRFS